MENKESGFIPVWRSMFSHWVWDNNEPFDKRSAWIDLLRSAELEDKTTMQDGKLINLKRGELKASLRYLQNRWNWGSLTKVENFLKNLEKDTMIVVEKRHGINVITICNYADYNDFEKTKRTAKGQQLEHDKDEENTEKGHEKDKVNNITINNKQEINNTPFFQEKNGTSPLPKKDEFILPENLRVGYLEVMQFSFNSENLKKLQKQLSPEEYQKIIENYGHSQLIEILGMMENSKSIKSKTSVYLTFLAFAKIQYGSKEIKKHYESFAYEYRNFIKLQSNGEVIARIDKYEERALRGIIEYLKESNTTNDYEGALKSWKYVLSLWKHLDPFMQQRIKLTEIEKDIVKILNYIKNEKNKRVVQTDGDKQKAGSERKDF